MRLLLVYILPFISIICAAILAYHRIEGWGWFLFIAAISGGSETVQNTLKKNKSA